MDFVVVGLGVGALAILLGLTIREAGPRWWPLRRDQPLALAEQARRLAIGRAGRAGGLVLCLAGGAIVVATIIAIGLSLSDQAGAILVMATISVTVLAGVAWGALYVARYHPRPLPRTPGRRAAPSWTDEASSLTGTIDTADTAVDQRGIRPDASDTGASEPEAPVAAEAPAEAKPVSSEADITDGDESGVATEPSPETSEQPTVEPVEPAVNGEALPRPPGFAISGKNQPI